MIKNFFKNLFATLYKNSVIIMVAATLCVVLSVGYTTMYAKVDYTAKAEVLVHSSSLTDLPQGAMTKSDVSIVDTSLEIFNSQSMFVFITENELKGKNYSADKLDEMIDVTRKDKDSLVLIVTVTCDDDDEALLLLDAYTKSMQPYFSGITYDFYVHILSIDDDAVMNKPNVATAVISGLIAGALLGAIIVILLDKFGQKLRGVSDYRARYSATLLGTVPDFSGKNKEGK